VLCFGGPRGSEAIVQRLSATPVRYETLWGHSDLQVVYETAVGGTRVCIVSRCVWGGPQAAIWVEELVCLGVTRIIGVGSAGSLVPDLPKGTHVVASTAIVTDGTSRACTKTSTLPANVALYAALEAVVDELEADVMPVKIATVDAVYRETDDAVRRWLGRDAQAINMETSPLYAASVVCGVKSLWIGRISDSLLGTLQPQLLSHPLGNLIGECGHAIAVVCALSSPQAVGGKVVHGRLGYSDDLGQSSERGSMVSPRVRRPNSSSRSTGWGM
jgi:uridine phosphorylase